MQHVYNLAFISTTYTENVCLHKLQVGIIIGIRKVEIDGLHLCDFNKLRHASGLFAQE